MQTDHQNFLKNPRRHVLMLTTHGVHEWNVVPGLTDTGGQNIYVNQFAEELTRQGYKVTIANRGGYPHPRTGEPQIGEVYNGPHQRIVYLNDGFNQFVRKEDIGERVTQLADHLAEIIQKEKSRIDLIISHYWDAAVIGILVKESLSLQDPHIWVPHSLGAIKKRNVSSQRWTSLRIDERIQNERSILRKVDFVGSTSPLISDSLIRDYHYQKSPLWLPPCVSTSRYNPHEVDEDAEVWKTLSQISGLPVSTLQRKKIISEISRTDTTKRKDVLIKAFAELIDEQPETLLITTIEDHNNSIGASLLELIKSYKVQENVVVLGSVWEILPDIYAISDIYCTPSIMEGFGMSAQEAAATGVPVIASSLVPFAVEYLHGKQIDPGSKSVPAFSVGEGAIIVQPDNISGFAQALSLLISDEQLRERMGREAYEITIPRFTWTRVVEQFIEAIN